MRIAEDIGGKLSFHNLLFTAHPQGAHTVSCQMRGTNCLRFVENCGVENKKMQNRAVKYWEIIADHLSKAGWTWGCVSAIDSHGRTIWIADAHRDDGKRFVVHADEKLTALLELESVICVCREAQK
jgi:hypothetical protein